MRPRFSAQMRNELDESGDCDRRDNNLGKIQGAAQMLTVLASAAGPLVPAASRRHFDCYQPLFCMFAASSALLGMAAWFTPAQRRSLRHQAV